MEHNNLYYIFQNDQQAHQMPEHRHRRMMEYLTQRLRPPGQEEEK